MHGYSFYNMRKRANAVIFVFWLLNAGRILIFNMENPPVNGKMILLFHKRAGSMHHNFLPFVKLEFRFP